MKFNKSSQLLLVSAASLLAAALITACGTLTTDFVFVTSSKAAGPNSYGEIDVFEINSVSGVMRQIPTSPFPSGGRNPVAEAVSSDNSNLYVVNQDDNTIVQFIIGSDGKLYPQSTVNTPGIFPLAVAVSGTNLFVVDTFQPLPTCSNADLCSGSVAVFPIKAASGTGSSTTPSGALGTPVANGSLNYWPLTLPIKPNAILIPTAITVLASGKEIYVTAYDWPGGSADIAGPANICNLKPSSFSGPTGYIFGFSVGTGGALTALPGSPFAAGTLPCAIASDSSGGYIYAADYATGQIFGYSVASGTLNSGDLIPLTSGTNGTNQFPTGNQPRAIVADSKSPYLYVANALDGTISAFSITAGALTSIGTYQAGIQPIAIGIDPSTHHFLFTVNFLGGSISDFALNATDGTLINTQRSPYASSTQPTAVAAIPHGSPRK